MTRPLALEDLTRPDAPRLVVSRFVTVSWAQRPGAGGAGVLFSPAARRSIEFEDARVLALLHRFAAPARVCDAAPGAEERRWVKTLVGAGVLVPVHRGRPAESAALRLWEPHDCAFHVLSRTGAGGTYRLQGRVKPLPLHKPPMSARVIPLPAPLSGEGPSFWSVLEGRRSTRVFAREPMPLERLAAVLHHAARDREGPRGAVTGRRAYPSGGALYPLEIYPLVPAGACAGLEGGLYHYRAQDHCLEHLAGPGRAGAAVLAGARRSALVKGRAWILLNLAARIGRTSWKYEGIAYSLILKEVGCLLQTLYLTAGALGLGCCAVGLGPLDALAAAAGLDPAEEPLVGELVLGVPARAPPRRPRP